MKLLILIAAIWVYPSNISHYVLRMPSHAGLEIEWIKTKHVVHGIWSSWRDEDGYWFVNAKGKRCRL